MMKWLKNHNVLGLFFVIVLVSLIPVFLSSSEYSLDGIYENNLEDYLPRCSSDVETHQHIVYNGFELCYVEDWEISEWSIHEITKHEVSNKNRVPRSDNFREDKSIESGTAVYSDYTNSGYDRGHLVPAADLAYSNESMNDSFYMSNMVPQISNLNRGTWKNLEDDSRYWAKKWGRVIVLSGPIPSDEESQTFIGHKNRVLVPNEYFKIIYAPDQGEMIGFILPNYGKVDKNYYNYSCTIDDIEAITGIDFFYILNNKYEHTEMQESKINLLFWYQ